MDDAQRSDSVGEVTEHVARTLSHFHASDTPVLPDEATLRKAESSLFDKLPTAGYGFCETEEHLLEDIVPGLNNSSLHLRYYGFVTGGVTPAARLGETIVSLYDQNAAVHLPNESLATTVEDKALKMLLDLFRLDREQWCGQFTTGATASNIVGLALGREHIINRAIEKASGGPNSKNTVGECGLLRACCLAGIEDIKVLTTKPHSSLGKAASVLGLGRSSIVDVGVEENGISFDSQQLERIMSEISSKNAFIVAVSCGEVNTGLFATNSLKTLQDLRALCDRYGAWLHVDGGEALNRYFHRHFKLNIVQRLASLHGFWKGSLALKKFRRELWGSNWPTLLEEMHINS